MCIICIKKAQKPMVYDERIKYMFSRNPDGAGIMWAEDNKVHIKKGFLTVQSLLDFIHSRDWTDVTAVLHFRIGTSGLRDQWNCHPFPLRQKNTLDGTCEIAVAHNGILSRYTPPRESKISDTQVFVEKMLNQLPKRFFENAGIRTLLDHELEGNRIVLLSKSGAINKWGTWYDDEDGYLYSNPYYKPYTPYLGTSVGFGYGRAKQMSLIPNDAPDCDDLSFSDRLQLFSENVWSMDFTKDEEKAIRAELDEKRVADGDDNWLSEDGYQEFVIDDNELVMYVYTDENF